MNEDDKYLHFHPDSPMAAFERKFMEIYGREEGSKKFMEGWNEFYEKEIKPYLRY